MFKVTVERIEVGQAQLRVTTSSSLADWHWHGGGAGQPGPGLTAEGTSRLLLLLGGPIQAHYY